MSARPRALRAGLAGYGAPLPILLALSGAAWLATHRLADGSMRLGLLTTSGGGSMSGMSGMDGMDGSSMSMAFGLFMATWITMMVAMMFPAVVPVVLTFRRWATSRGRPAATASFVAGYLVVWAAIGTVAYGVLQALHEWAPTDGSAAVRVGAVLLAVAGVYQLTPLKDVCLRHCRSPLSVLVQHGSRLSRGHAGPWEVGVLHGAYCVGCCWSLMLVLALLGMMNLVWMGVVAAVVFVEKVLPHGRLLGHVVGVALIGLGVALAVWPHALPAMT